jgi:outer membrane lipoprotein-sorting protein
MSELGDLLELMYTAAKRYTTLRATIREWQHLARSERAFQRYAETLDAPGGRGSMVMMGFGFSAGQPPDETEALIEIWMAPPARMRMERTGYPEAHTVVSDGEQEWAYSPSLGAIVNPAAGSYHGFEHLTDPSLLLAQLEVEVTGRASAPEREAILVRATRRGREWHDPAGLPEGADHHELAVDAERGVLLRTVSFLDGQEFHSHEALEIAFDEAFPEDTFVFTPPAGEEIRDAESAYPPQEDVTIEEAARLAPFTVLERLERDGQTMGCCEQFGQRLLLLERHGTHVMVTSDLDRETLVEIALSLEPAPAEPPRLVDV